MNEICRYCLGPEPTVGTVVAGIVLDEPRIERVAVKRSDGYWYVTGYDRVWTWKQLIATLKFDTVRVLGSVKP